MLEIPIEPVLTFLLVLMRVLFFFAFLPMFGEVFTPIRVRVVLAATVALVFTPMVLSRQTVFPQTLAQFIALLGPEAVLGAALGLVGRILFGAMQFAGEIMGEQIGFAMAAMVDPAQGAGQIPVLAETFYIVSLLVFFGVNGHHHFLNALARSFEQAPPGLLGVSGGLAAFFTQKTAEMFAIAIQMSLPIVAIVFAANMAMGMVAKAVPQINVFLESFPIRIMAGLFLLSVTIGFMVRMMTGSFSRLPGDLSSVLALMSR